MSAHSSPLPIEIHPTSPHQSPMDGHLGGCQFFPMMSNAVMNILECTSFPTHWGILGGILPPSKIALGELFCRWDWDCLHKSHSYFAFYLFIFLRIYLVVLSFFFFFAALGLLLHASFSLCCIECGILVPEKGMESSSPALEGRFLTTGPPRQFPHFAF